MKIIFIVLGLIDIFTAALIFFPFSEAILLYIMVYILAKGGFFLMTGLASKSIGPHCIALCVSDILVGIALGTIALGYGTVGNVGTVPLFLKAVGIIGVIKGVYTTAFPLLS